MTKCPKCDYINPPQMGRCDNCNGIQPRIWVQELDSYKGIPCFVSLIDHGRFPWDCVLYVSIGAPIHCQGEQKDIVRRYLAYTCVMDELIGPCEPGKVNVNPLFKALVNKLRDLVTSWYDTCRQFDEKE